MAKFLPQGSLGLDVQAAGSESEWLVIPQGLTIRFTITRRALASTQTAQFRVYGLSDKTRDEIYKDRFDLTLKRRITFRAGYTGFSPVIFDGYILQAYSDKEGQTDTVTVIDAFDGGFQMTSGFVATTVPPGTTADQVISSLGATLPGIQSKPIVGSFPQANLRSEILVGNTWGIIQQKSGGNATIDNSQVKALNPNEALAGSEIPLISAQTGLIGVPRRSGALVEFDMVFEPRLNLFQLVDLETRFNPQFNGPHKVIGFEHRGGISTSHAIPNITTGSFVFFSNPVASDDLKGILTSG